MIVPQAFFARGLRIIVMTKQCAIDGDDWHLMAAWAVVHPAKGRPLTQFDADARAD
jgi:hypothetical protein